MNVITQMKIKLVYLHKKSRNNLLKVLGETINLAVLDSGCSKTVCEEWLSCYLDTLSQKEQKEIQTVKSDPEVKFGGVKSVSSKRCVSIP